jgi:hypothetical protein
MHLWNDYEGKTIAEHYPLKKLLRPEGRSAFFTTSTEEGGSEVIRLTETLNDECETLERLRHVTEVQQPNLVTIKKYGQTTYDGVPLTYALIESTDSSLAEILTERPLTPAETTEVATSVTAALRALHASDLIHERVEPASVVASGELIKLRSDCVRECVPDPEFNPEALCLELKQRDVRDLGTLLLQCLTLEKTYSTNMRLPAPFNAIIPRALDGTWGLAEIAEALTPPVAAPERPLVPDKVLAEARYAAPVAAAPVSRAEQMELPVLPTRKDATPEVERYETGEKHMISGPILWIAVGVIALVLLLLAIHLSGSKPVASAPVPVPAATHASSAAPAPVASTPGAPANDPAAPSPAVTQAGWHVVAYTYNHQEAAWKKAADLRKHHSGLHPEVFSPTGQAPWLVTLGSAMSQSEAEATLRQARRARMPRDSYVRFYPANR